MPQVQNVRSSNIVLAKSQGCQQFCITSATIQAVLCVALALYHC